MENEEGRKLRWSGSLLDESFQGVDELSDLVREKLILMESWALTAWSAKK